MEAVSRRVRGRSNLVTANVCSNRHNKSRKEKITTKFHTFGVLVVLLALCVTTDGCLEPSGDHTPGADMYFWPSEGSFESSPLHPLEGGGVVASGNETSWTVVAHGYLPAYYGDLTLTFVGHNDDVSVSAVMLYGYPDSETGGTDWSDAIRCDWGSRDVDGDLTATVSAGVINIYWSELVFDAHCSFVLTDGHITAMLP